MTYMLVSPLRCQVSTSKHLPFVHAETYATHPDSVPDYVFERTRGLSWAAE